MIIYRLHKLQPAYSGFKQAALLLVLCTVFHSPSWAQAPMDILVDEWPPYHYLNKNNQVSGFASDVFSAVMGEMGIPFTLTLEPFDSVLSKVKEGKVHGSFLAAEDENRRSFAYFSNEVLYESEWVLLSRKSQGTPIKKYSDLAGLSIGVVKNYIYSPDFLAGTKANNILLMRNASDSLNYQMLFMGKVKYITGEKDNSLWYLKRNNLQDNIQVVPEFVIARNPLYFIWSKKRSSQAFADRFAMFLKDFKKTPKFKELLKNYMAR